jgi:outer membrane protease
MFSRTSGLIAIVPFVLAASALAPARAADYGSGCSVCGGGNYEVDYDAPGGGFTGDSDFSVADPDANFVLRGSVGAASITGVEHIYTPPDGANNLSELIWTGVSPIGSLDASARLFDGWTLRGHLDAALPGQSKMTDYDWIPPYNTGYGMDDWSDRSISPNTHLDWYFSGDVALGRDLPINEAVTVNLNGGFKYTDTQWTAVGGSYIYSTGGFRNDVGNFPDVPGIRYRQQLPVVFVGANATVKDGPWTVDAGGRAGLVLLGQARDDHYLRVPPRYTIDQMTWGKMLSADAKIDYAVSDHLGLFVEGSYEKTFADRVPKQYRQISDNSLMLPIYNIGGGELAVASLKVGLKGEF